jgi:hypothetical protein
MIRPCERRTVSKKVDIFFAFKRLLKGESVVVER